MKVIAVLFGCVCLVAFVAADDVPDVSQDDTDASPETRGWNPFNGLAAKAKSSCSCPMGDRCECCFNVPFVGSKGCLGGRLIEGQIELQLSMSGLVLVNKQFPLVGKQQVCGAIPKVNSVQFCLDVGSKPIPGGVSSCAGVALKIKGQVGGSVQFPCLDARGGKLSVGGYN